jgi:hypothetical protein
MACHAIKGIMTVAGVVTDYHERAKPLAGPCAAPAAPAATRSAPSSFLCRETLRVASGLGVRRLRGCLTDVGTLGTTYACDAGRVLDGFDRRA